MTGTSTQDVAGTAGLTSGSVAPIIRLRDVMLAGVLPTAAALAVATVILVERLQSDVSARSSIESMTSLNFWFVCAFAFGLAHMLGTWITWRTTRAGLLQRLAFIALFVAASFWPAFGGVFTQLMTLQAAFLLALSFLMFFLPMLLVPLVTQIPSYLFGALLALAVAPALKSLSLQRLWRLTVVYGAACLVAGPFAVWGMFALDLQILSAGASAAVPAMVIAVWTIASTTVWTASLEARERGSLLRLLHSPAAYCGGAALFMLAAACIVIVGTMVERRQTVFGLGETAWPAKLVELVRGGRPPLDAPLIHSGRRFAGPFVSKSRGPGSGGKVDGLTLMLPGWAVRGTAVTLRFNRKRAMQLLTCPELTAGIARCRTIRPPWNEPLLQVTVPRQVYFSGEGDYEFSQAIPNVSLWRTRDASGSTRCWLDLEDWPAQGDAVRAEADCDSPWPQQAARLRALLEAQFAPVR